MTEPAPPAGVPHLREEFRAAMARLPAGVCVVTLARTRGGSVTDHAMTATSVVPVSLDPPMVLFCVHRDARLREELDGTPAWAVSVLDAGGAGAAEWLASPGRPSVGQLDGVPHRRGALTGAALLASAQAWLECRTEWVREAGDHDVVVGTVRTVEVDARATGALVHRLGRLLPIPG